MSGEMLDLNGIDVNVIVRKAISNTTASDFTLGIALLYGEMNIDTFEEPVRGVVVHGSYNREYQAMKKPVSSLTLFWGLPLSYGNFVIDNGEVVTMYTVMTGLQGGAQLGLKTGDFMSSPFVMVHLLGGYMEHYNGDDGDVYYKNRNFLYKGFEKKIFGTLKLLCNFIGFHYSKIFKKIILLFRNAFEKH